MRTLTTLFISSLAGLTISLSSCGGSNNSEHHHERANQDTCEAVIEEDIFEAELYDENIAYSACLDCNILDDRTMEVWGPKNVCKDSPRPIVMFVPGNSSTPAVEFIRPIVENGFVVAIPKCTNLKSEINQDNTMEALRCGVNDLTDAIRKVKFNAAKYGADTTKVFLSGYGSGATVSLNYCYIRGLYDGVDMNGIKGLILCSPNASLNFSELSRNEDCKLKTVILSNANDLQASLSVANEIKRQLGNLVTHRKLTNEEQPTYVVYYDSLAAITDRFVDEVLKK